MIKFYSRGQNWEFHLWLSNCLQFFVNWYFQKNNNKFVGKLKLLSISNTCLYCVILYLNGNEKRKNRRKLPLVIKFYSRGQNWEFCNFLINWYFQKNNNKFVGKLKLLSFSNTCLYCVILYLNGNEKRKNRRKLPLVIKFYSRGQNWEFCNFLINWYFQKNNNKFVGKLKLLSFSNTCLYCVILYLNGNEKRKNRRKLPLVIKFYSRGQNWEFCNFLINWYFQKNNNKFVGKLKLLSISNTCLYCVILYLNGNEKRKNRRKLPLVIKFYSRGQNWEFCNFLINWYFQKNNNKFVGKLKLLSISNTCLYCVILYLNGNEKRKNRRKLPLVIKFYSRGQNWEFCNCFDQLIFSEKQQQIRWKTQIIEYF